MNNDTRLALKAADSALAYSGYDSDHWIRTAIRNANESDPPTRFSKGQNVKKTTGDYGGPGVVEEVIVTADGRERYLVSYKIEGGFGSILLINNANQLEPSASS